MSKASRSPAELRNMFGANLRQLSRVYPSISELSRQLGINRTQFNRYLSGESFPRPDVLDRICNFFEVDARILLEPVDNLQSSGSVLNGPTLGDFLGPGLSSLTETEFPNGIYLFSRRSFTNDKKFLLGLVRVFRIENQTYIRGFEAKEAMRHQGLPIDVHTREFRGYAARQEEGVALVITRRKSLTCSFNYLARVASFENNFWVGYATRTVRESPTETRATRMVYELLGSDIADVLAAARRQGYASAENLPAYHRRLLQIDAPFR